MSNRSHRTYQSHRIESPRRCPLALRFVQSDRRTLNEHAKHNWLLCCERPKWRPRKIDYQSPVPDGAAPTLKRSCRGHMRPGKIRCRSLWQWIINDIVRDKLNNIIRITAIKCSASHLPVIKRNLLWSRSHRHRQRGIADGVRRARLTNFFIDFDKLIKWGIKANAYAAFDAVDEKCGDIIAGC